MQEFVLGQVGIVPRGNYVSSITYIPLNTVSTGGGTWICIKTATGIEPGVTASWAEYWQPFANGVKSITVSDGAAGKVNMKLTYTNGETANFTFSSTALGANSVGTNELKNDAVTGVKVADNTLGAEKLTAAAKKKFAPAYSFGTVDLVPGSPSTEPEGTIHWIVASA